AMVHQVVELYDRLVAPVAPVTGEAADLLALIRTLDLDGYVTLIGHLRADDPGDPTLFGRRWPVEHLRDILGRSAVRPAAGGTAPRLAPPSPDPSPHRRGAGRA